MTKVAYKEQIDKTLINITDLSYKEKKEPVFSEEKINEFLDSILALKEALKAQTNNINEVIEAVEGITWFTDLDEASLIKVNHIIALIGDLHATLIRQYARLNGNQKKSSHTRSIAKEELTEYKNAIDDLKESSQDLEAVFFHLPKNEAFVETMKNLSEL